MRSAVEADAYQGKGNYATYSSFVVGATADRRSTYLALQRRLGLLSERRSGTDFAHRLAGRSSAIATFGRGGGDQWRARGGCIPIFTPPNQRTPAMYQRFESSY